MYCLVLGLRLSDSITFEKMLFQYVPKALHIKQIFLVVKTFEIQGIVLLGPKLETFRKCLERKIVS